MANIAFIALIRNEGSFFSATVPDLPAITALGGSMDEIKVNIKIAVTRFINDEYRSGRFIKDAYYSVETVDVRVDDDRQQP